jgi:hypothetical protein
MIDVRFSCWNILRGKGSPSANQAAIQFLIIVTEHRPKRQVYHSF